MRNILSVDFESWVHFETDALYGGAVIGSSEDRRVRDGGYIEEATPRLLDLLDQHDQRATFFVVAEIYDWFPQVVESIHQRGHEIAYHTHTHRLLRNARVLRDELRRSSRFLERFRPSGFRAPLIYLTRDSMACLGEHGFRYSSSTYSGHDPYEIEGMTEIPVSTLELWGRPATEPDALPKNLRASMLLRSIPFGSGIFVSLLGSATSRLIERRNAAGKPAVLFVHPWQMFQGGEIKGAAFKGRVLMRNPLCLPYTRCILDTVRTLLSRHQFVSFEDLYGG